MFVCVCLVPAAITMLEAQMACYSANATLVRITSAAIQSVLAASCLLGDNYWIGR